MDRLTPTRTLTATRTVIVTTTHETELTRDEFLSLTPMRDITIRLFDQETAINLDRLAVKIINDYGDLFTAIATCTSDLNPEFRAILEIVNTFNYERFGKLTLSEFSETVGYTLLDGNRRSVALALLLKAEQIDYQPVTAVHTETNQSVSEPFVDSQGVTATIDAAAQGMRHYPIRKRS